MLLKSNNDNNAPYVTHFKACFPAVFLQNMERQTWTGDHHIQELVN